MKAHKRKMLATQARKALKLRNTSQGLRLARRVVASATASDIAEAILIAIANQVESTLDMLAEEQGETFEDGETIKESMDPAPMTEAAQDEIYQRVDLTGVSEEDLDDLAKEVMNETNGSMNLGAFGLGGFDKINVDVDISFRQIDEEDEDFEIDEFSVEVDYVITWRD